MRPTRSQGRPGTAVIPDGWGTSHAPVAAKTMPSTVNLRRPGAVTAWSDANQRTEPTPLAPYATGQAARVRAQTARAANREGEQVTETLVVSGYMVTLDLDRAVDAEPAIGDLIDVTASDDSQLTGATLRITDVVIGSHRFERDVLAELTRPAATS